MKVRLALTNLKAGRLDGPLDHSGLTRLLQQRLSKNNYCAWRGAETEQMAIRTMFGNPKDLQKLVGLSRSRVINPPHVELVEFDPAVLPEAQQLIVEIGDLRLREDDWSSEKQQALPGVLARFAASPEKQQARLLANVVAGRLARSSDCRRQDYRGNLDFAAEVGIKIDRQAPAVHVTLLGWQSDNK